MIFSENRFPLFRIMLYGNRGTLVCRNIMARARLRDACEGSASAAARTKLREISSIQGFVAQKPRQPVDFFQ
jgi:hypothetical protein